MTVLIRICTYIQIDDFLLIEGLDVFQLFLNDGVIGLFDLLVRWVLCVVYVLS